MNIAVTHGLHPRGSETIERQSREPEGAGADLRDLRMLGAPILEPVRALVSFGYRGGSAYFTPDAAHTSILVESVLRLY